MKSRIKCLKCMFHPYINQMLQILFENGVKVFVCQAGAYDNLLVFTLESVWNQAIHFVLACRQRCSFMSGIKGAKTLTLVCCCTTFTVTHFSLTRFSVCSTQQLYIVIHQTVASSSNVENSAWDVLISVFLDSHSGYSRSSDHNCHRLISFQSPSLAYFNFLKLNYCLKKWNG